MEYEEQFILQKRVDWSLLKFGIAIPIAAWNLFGKWDPNILTHGHSRRIKILMGDELFDATLVNQNFDQKKFQRHKDLIQIRYSENSPIAIKLQNIFRQSYNCLSALRDMPENNGRLIKLPEDVQESIRLYFTSNPDVLCIDCSTDADYKSTQQVLGKLSEEVYEAMDEASLLRIDEMASIVERERLVKYRRIDRSIITMLKRHYGYRDEITGEKIGSEYGESVVEAHHIDYFTTSQNNDSTNIIIISPNYHRIIHRNNPHFNRRKFQFEFPNGEVLPLKLYDHLMV